MPIILKGILSPADARMALDHGVDAIVVSNHGGRVTDGLITPMKALPSIARTIDGKCPILLDSGVRTGTDVLKAISLGASAVMIGRPQLHALAVAGMAGVAHMLHMIRAEFELAMAQVGVKSLDELGPAYVTSSD
ncbi:alpha-hydroxy acid oxidase [Sphingobium rhizovicinum]|uniref:Alpha-hydroxy acid oxidase n=1 Tax=Sphingobium rhizovicinum TaxID=432308 RepID=A0ABV7N816_9SPHN